LVAAIDFSDTTVIFVGDNGTPPLRVEPPFDPNHAKFTVYEGGLNVPLIVAGQAVPLSSRGQESAALVQATDFYRTVLDLAGLQAQGAPESRSFLPSVEDPASDTGREFVYAELFKPNGGPPDPLKYRRAVRDDRYKLIRLSTTGVELYDLLLDPFEQSPLPLSALTPEQAQAFDRLDVEMMRVTSPEVPSVTGWALGLVAPVLGAFGFARLRRARPGFQGRRRGGARLDEGRVELTSMVFVGVREESDGSWTPPTRAS